MLRTTTNYQLFLRISLSKKKDLLVLKKNEVLKYIALLTV
jgi:hypothetical protein